MEAIPYLEVADMAQKISEERIEEIVDELNDHEAASGDMDYPNIWEDLILGLPEYADDGSDDSSIIPLCDRSVIAWDEPSAKWYHMEASE